MWEKEALSQEMHSRKCNPKAIKILVFGKHGKPRESESMLQEGTLVGNCPELLVMLRHLALILPRIGTNQPARPLTDKTHCDWAVQINIRGLRRGLNVSSIPALIQPLSLL